MIRFKSISVGAGIWLVAMLPPCVGSGVSVHAATADVLNSASMQSKRAATRTMLAITRAGERLVAVGERGIVLLSDDDGKAWRQARVPVSVTLTGVHFPTPGKGWVVGHGGVVLHSADAGETWIKQLDGIQAAMLISEFARGKARTEDSASARAILADAERLVSEGPDKPFLDVHFFDERRGLVVGAFGLAFTTDDGGHRWHPWLSHIPNPGGKHLYRIHPRTDELWIVGEQGALFRSRDGGGSFVEERIPYVGSLFGMISDMKCNLLVYGLRGNAFHSPDCGENWKKIGNAIEATFTGGARLIDGTLVLVDQAGRILRSTDEGRNFVPLSTNQPFPLTGITQGVDGSLVLTSVRGVLRVSVVKPGDSQQ